MSEMNSYGCAKIDLLKSNCLKLKYFNVIKDYCLFNLLHLMFYFSFFSQDLYHKFLSQPQSFT